MDSIANGVNGSNKSLTRGSYIITVRSFIAEPSRLIYHLWEHDTNMCMVKNRQPIISYAEITLCLPASRSLWLAPTAEIWRRRYLTARSESVHASLRTLLEDHSTVLCVPSGIDVNIARSAYLHGLAAQIWEHSQQAVLLSRMSDPSAQLWSQTQQQNL